MHEEILYCEKYNFKNDLYSYACLECYKTHYL